jgi:hypothetical protein
MAYINQDVKSFLDVFNIVKFLVPPIMNKKLHLCNFKQRKFEVQKCEKLQTKKTPTLGFFCFQHRDIFRFSTCYEHLIANVKDATVLGSIPASFDTVESD